MFGFTGRRGTVGLAVLALAVGVSTSAAALPGGGAGAGAGDCPEVRGKVERLEGRITPNACAFMQRQIAFGELPTGALPVPGDLGHPRVKAYLDIFDPEASLWEAGAAAQRGEAVIGTSIARSLRIAPDLAYRGTQVVTEGSTMMFGQWNEVTLKGRKVAYPQVARNVLGDDGRTLQARRYYDRHALFADTVPGAPAGLFAGIADPAPGGQEDRRSAERVRAAEIPARLAMWNGEDAEGLSARVRGARLAGPGLASPLVTEAGKRAYLERFFATADVRLRAGQAAFGRTTTYLEWHGTATTKGFGTVPFGIVERFGPDGEWELYFDTLPLIASGSGIGSLFAELATP
ncbi:hypothetical protein [Streptomyces sp. NPDC093225]|uniref:hypothetical protein n=1 Tax=Streptomyces sp. NPDC093225 TaxID=3366034 RepID=UPI00380D8AD1